MMILFFRDFFFQNWLPSRDMKNTVNAQSVEQPMMRMSPFRPDIPPISVRDP
jgi:hypothetical protein